MNTKLRLVDKSKKKFFGGIVGLFILAFLVIIPFLGGGVLKIFLEKAGSRATQTSVKIFQLYLAPWSGGGRAYLFSVGNPEGYSFKKAFQVKSFTIDLNPMTVFEDVIVINRITINSPEIYYESKGGKTNFDVLQQNIENFTRQFANQEAKKSSARSGKKCIVHSLVIKDARVHWRKQFLGDTVLKLPTLELHHIGVGSEGVRPGDIAALVIRQLNRSLLTTAARSGEEIFQKGKESLKSTSGFIRKLF